MRRFASRLTGTLMMAGVLLLGACAVPLGTSAGTQDSPTRAVTPSKRVVGYFVEWGIYAAHDQYFVTSIPFSKLTHINYAFVGINPTSLAVEIYDPWASLEIVYPGEAWDTPYKGNLGMLRKAKLQYPGLKVLISVGGWTKSHGFHAAAATDATRTTTAKNLVAFMTQYGLDGIDIDWEYPGVNRPADPNDQFDKGSPGGPEDKVNYTLFLKAIRDELDRQGVLDGGKHYELTTAAGIGYDKIDLTQPDQYAQYLDAINLMTYDMHGGFETVIGHQAPLYANPHDTHETLVNERYNIDWAVNKFLSYNVPSSKIILGIPFYSRGWDNVSGGWDVDGNGTPDGMFGTGGGGLAGKWGAGGQNPYFTMKTLQTQSGWEKFRDPISMVPWIYNRTAKQLLSFDDAQSVGTKMDYALSKNLGGAMYWELDGDDWQNGYDLVNVIAAKMLTGGTGDTQAPTAPTNVHSTGVTTTSVTLAWTAATDNVGVTAYVVTWPTGTSTVTTTSATLSGLTASTNYTFTVKARDAAGNLSPGATATVKTADVTSDTQAPTVPANLRSTGTTSNSVSLAWDASTDNVGVTGYVVSGPSTSTVTGTSATITGLAADTTYTFSVKAVDAAGNQSAASSVPIKTAPATAIGPATGVPATPALSQSTWNGEAAYTIKTDIWWGNNATTFELLENGVSVSTKSLVDNSPNAQSVSVSFTGKANGTYRYVAKLTNRFGTITSAELAYTVTQGGTGGGDTQAPGTVGNLRTTSVSSSSVALAWDAATDNVGVTSYTISWTGGSTTATSTSVTVSGLAASTSYTFSVRAKDAAGNQGASVSITAQTQAQTGGTYPAWALNTAYALGDKVSYLGKNYQCASAHTSYSPTWDPVDAPTLWTLIP